MPEPVSTQVIPRDRHAMFFATLAVIASSIERLSTEIRHLQRTEVLEAEEYFSPGQKGSSAMPHKRNPVLTENLTGLARMVRAYAIGSELAGEIYGVKVLFDDVSDDVSNLTRFYVISRQQAKPSGDDKTSIMFATADEPGALMRVLQAFDRAGVNLTHIDKRPSGRVNWTYTFFVDAVGHRDDPNVAQAIEEARAICQELTVIGSYPRSRRIL